MALPGTLPVLNHEAVTKAIIFGLGVGAEIGKVSALTEKIIFIPTYQRLSDLTILRAYRQRRRV